MEKFAYQFDESEWGAVGVGLDYSATPELQDEVALLKLLYCEITAWSDLSVFTAWGSYSQDHHELHWQPVSVRDNLFLAYLYHIEHAQGTFSWTDTDARLALDQLIN